MAITAPAPVAQPDFGLLDVAVRARAFKRRVVRAISAVVIGAVVVLASSGCDIDGYNWSRTYHSAGFTYTCWYRTALVHTGPVWGYGWVWRTWTIGGDPRFC